MSPLLAPSFEAVFPGGSMNRSQQLAAIQPTPAGDNEEVVNRKIRNYGETAVVTLEYVYTSAASGSERLSVVAVWSLHEGRWQLVFTAATPAQGGAQTP